MEQNAAVVHTAIVAPCSHGARTNVALIAAVAQDAAVVPAAAVAHNAAKEPKRIWSWQQPWCLTAVVPVVDVVHNATFTLEQI